MKTNPCRLTYSTLIYMRESCLWAIEDWFSEHLKGTSGALDESERYLKIFNYIEYRMGKFVGEVV